MFIKNNLSIFGANGFIGTAFKKVNKDQKRFNYFSRSSIGDFTIYKNLLNANISNSDVLLLASDTNKNSSLSYQKNIKMIKNFAKFCKNNSSRCFFISSYIPSPEINYDKLNFYQKSKLDSEKILKSQLGNNCYIIRLPNIFGEIQYGFPIKNFIDLSIDSFLKKKKLLLFKPLIYRTYIHVDEIAIYINNITQNTINIRNTLNLNIFKPLSNYQIINYILKKYGNINYEIIYKKDNKFINYIHKNKISKNYYQIKNCINNYFDYYLK